MINKLRQMIRAFEGRCIYCGTSAMILHRIDCPDAISWPVMSEHKHSFERNRKEGEMIDEEQYITTQHQLVTLAGLVKDLPLDGFIETASHAETVGPFLYPTVYREAAERLSDAKALATALLPFKTEIVRQWSKAKAAGVSQQ